MFIDIWDLENKAIKINKFNKYYYNVTGKTGSKIEFSSTDNGFNQVLYFTSIDDCFRFLFSGTFTYLFDSEDIDYIQIKAGKSTIFKYDNKG